MTDFMAKISHIAQLFISMLVLSAFIGTVAALLFSVAVDFPPGVREVLLVLVGVLAGAFKDVVGFWLGSSVSSQKKDAVIAAK